MKKRKLSELEEKIKRNFVKRGRKRQKRRKLAIVLLRPTNSVREKVWSEKIIKL